MRKCDVGGQAIIEGVMMRGSKGLATAIRTPNGKIEVKVKKTKPITKKYKMSSFLSFQQVFDNILAKIRKWIM